MNHFENPSLPEAFEEIPEERYATIKNNYYFISGNDLLSDPIEIDYLIDGVIETGTTGQIFGPSGTGKTFVALSMALAIATGTNWNGQEVKKGIVLYLTGEGREGIKRRIASWQKFHGEQDLSCLHISRMTIAIDEQGPDIVISQGKALSDDLGVPVTFIVIDTLARHLIGDENATKDMGLFVQAVDSIRDAFPGASISLVHHTGKNPDSQNFARGSSALRAAMDFEIRCDKRKLIFTKMKDAELPESIPFELVPVEIGTKKNGKPVTSCVVTYGKCPGKDESVKLTDLEMKGVRALLEVSAKEDRRISDKYAGDTESWRQEFYAIRKNENIEIDQGTLKKSFQNVVKGLTGKGALDQIGSDSILSRADHQDDISNLILQQENIRKESGTGN